MNYKLYRVPMSDRNTKRFVKDPNPDPRKSLI